MVPPVVQNLCSNFRRFSCNFQAQFLVGKGAKLPTNKGIYLADACANGRLGMVQWLIESGISDISAVRPIDGATPLSVAAHSGCVETVNYLLQKGARDPKLTVRTNHTPFPRNILNTARPHF